MLQRPEHKGMHLQLAGYMQKELAKLFKTGGLLFIIGSKELESEGSLWLHVRNLWSGTYYSIDDNISTK